MSSILKQVEITEECGTKLDAITELGYVWGGGSAGPEGSMVPTCFLPQHTHLLQLLELNPRAKFILNKRDFTAHVNSMRRWGKLNERFLQNCT